MTSVLFSLPISSIAFNFPFLFEICSRVIYTFIMAQFYDIGVIHKWRNEYFDKYFTLDPYWLRFF
jgi:hypothetical protein